MTTPKTLKWTSIKNMGLYDKDAANKDATVSISANKLNKLRAAVAKTRDALLWERNRCGILQEPLKSALESLEGL